MGSESNPSSQTGVDGASRRSKKLDHSSRWFSLAGLALIGTSLNNIIFASLPPKLASPDWQLRIISQILSSSSFLLIGTLLVCWARTLNVYDNTLRRRANILRSFSNWFALVLILFIPFQIYAGFRALTQIKDTELNAINQLRSSIAIIRSLNTENELRAYLANLPNQASTPPRFDAPFPVVKQRGIANLTASLNATINQSQIQSGQRLQTFIAEATRNSIHALLMAIGFYSIGQGNRERSTIPQSLLQSVLRTARLAGKTR